MKESKLREKPLDAETVLKAIRNQMVHPVIQVSRPLRRTESDLERLNRQTLWILMGW